MDWFAPPPIYSTWSSRIPSDNSHINHSKVKMSLACLLINSNLHRWTRPPTSSVSSNELQRNLRALMISTVLTFKDIEERILKSPALIIRMLTLWRNPPVLEILFLYSSYKMLQELLLVYPYGLQGSSDYYTCAFQSKLICSRKFPSRIGCLFTFAKNHLSSKPYHNQLITWYDNHARKEHLYRIKFCHRGNKDPDKCSVRVAT